METLDKVSLSVIVYENSLRVRFQIFTKELAMTEISNIEEACNLAEKYQKKKKKKKKKKKNILKDAMEEPMKFCCQE